MPRAKTVKCERCGARIARDQAFGVSGMMNLSTLTIDYRTFRCADESACEKRKAS